MGRTISASRIKCFLTGTWDGCGRWLRVCGVLYEKKKVIDELEESAYNVCNVSAEDVTAVMGRSTWSPDAQRGDGWWKSS